MAPPLSRNAVKSMVRGAEMDPKEPFLVKVCGLTADSAIVCDAQDFVKAVILAQNYDSRVSVVAKVTSYVVSQGNLNLESSLCITGLEIVKKDRNPEGRMPSGEPFELTQGRIQGGRVPQFIGKRAPFLSTKALAGCLASEVPASMNTRLQTVSDFMSKHHAMSTLHRSSSLSSDTAASVGALDNGDSGSNAAPVSSPMKVYMSVLDQFQSSQMDRQKASLTSNEGRENAANATRIVKQHQTALKDVLEYEGELSLTKLNSLHRMLCEGLVQDAGALRTKNVRVSVTTFTNHEAVKQLTQAMLKGICTLDSRWIQHPAAKEEKATAAVTFAAAVFMSLVDSHIYSDGNGRLARIAANWALRRAGFPFVIHFFATPVQRAEYSSAVRQTRRNLDLIPRGEVSEEILLQAYQKLGCLQPIVQLILDRLHKAIVEFNTLVAEKESTHNEEAEARMACRFRERAAQGTCLICFESNPNIATLCCGKAVHLNCMAQWLSANSSCPQCRGPLPKIPERMRPRAPAAPDINDTTNSTTDDGESTTDDATTVDDDTTVTVQAVVPPPPPPNDDTTTDETTDDTTSVAMASPDNNDTTSTSDDTTTSVAPQQQQQVAQQPEILYCFNCNNRAARDCSNGGCGRCCVLHGGWQCARHGQT